MLESIPWDKVDIEVITIESNHMGEVFPGSQVTTIGNVLLLQVS